MTISCCPCYRQHATLNAQLMMTADDWNQYVRFCRKKDDPAQKHTRLSKTADLIKGHICTKVSSGVARIQKANVQTSARMIS